MLNMQRQSPAFFPQKPVKTRRQDDWVIAEAYPDEGAGPWLVDLCHSPRWDLQDGRLDDFRPTGCEMPTAPGDCRWAARVLVNRMNRTQAAVWHLGRGAAPLPADPGYTDVSEATVFLGLFGPRIFALAEHLTSLDLGAPQRRPPFLLQGPLAHVPCQVVVLAREDGGSGGLLLTCSRGYARDMVQVILAAGAAYGLRPAGEDRFNAWLDGLNA